MSPGFAILKLESFPHLGRRREKKGALALHPCIIASSLIATPHAGGLERRWLHRSALLLAPP
jgi:hypothetical protein